MAKVLFIGEINVDVIMGGMESPPLVDREVPCKTYDVEMGASTVICACCYAALGGQAWFAGLAGEDEYGEFMVRGLARLGVRTDLVQRTRQVRTGVTINMIHANTRTQVTYPGTIAAFDGAGLDAGVLRAFDHIHFGGVYLETALLPHITGLLRTARELGLSTSLDPQWDPSGRWERLEDWLPLLTYYFSNFDETLSVSGTARAEDGLQFLAARTACPVVKMGRAGALALVDGEPAAVPVHPVQPVDTTGAGDSFDAGFLFARLEKDMDLLAAARFANAVAARSCLFTGGVSARTTYAQALEFLDRA